MKFKWMPVIDADKCTGCNLCVEACGPKCLELVEGIAALPRPDQCGSEEHCIAVCRDDAIHMQWIPFQGNQDVGRWGSVSLSSNDRRPGAGAPTSTPEKPPALAPALTE